MDKRGLGKFCTAMFPLSNYILSSVSVHFERFEEKNVTIINYVKNMAIKTKRKNSGDDYSVADNLC